MSVETFGTQSEAVMGESNVEKEKRRFVVALLGGRKNSVGDPHAQEFLHALGRGLSREGCLVRSGATFPDSATQAIVEGVMEENAQQQPETASQKGAVVEMIRQDVVSPSALVTRQREKYILGQRRALAVPGTPAQLTASLLRERVGMYIACTPSSDSSGTMAEVMQIFPDLESRLSVLQKIKGTVTRDLIRQYVPSVVLVDWGDTAGNLIQQQIHSSRVLRRVTEEGLIDEVISFVSSNDSKPENILEMIQHKKVSYRGKLPSLEEPSK